MTIKNIFSSLKTNKKHLENLWKPITNTLKKKNTFENPLNFHLRAPGLVSGFPLDDRHRPGLSVLNGKNAASRSQDVWDHLLQATEKVNAPDGSSPFNWLSQQDQKNEISNDYRPIRDIQLTSPDTFLLHLAFDSTKNTPHFRCFQVEVLGHRTFRVEGVGTMPRSHEVHQAVRRRSVASLSKSWNVLRVTPRTQKIQT